MELKYKPDLKRVKQYWNAFWNGEIIDRPCVSITAPKDESGQKERPPYLAGNEDGFLNSLKMFEEWADSTYFAGEAIPVFEITFGPDQLSAFSGAELKMAPHVGTSWVEPFVDDWKTAKIELREDNPNWKRMLKYLHTAADFGDGKFLLSVLDMHSNLDWLAGIRGPNELCLDMMDCPDEIEAAMGAVRALYMPLYEAVYEAGDMKNRGTIGWAPFYCEGKFACLQSDVICLIGPEHTRRFAIPALAEEAAFLDHSMFHLDGPGAVVHLDDILAINDIDVIQWIPGVGNPPQIEWMDLLKKIQNAGKGLHICECTPDIVKIFHKELRPEGVLYDIEVSSRQEADELISWLKSNT
jgi:hypothetical protein